MRLAQAFASSLVLALALLSPAALGSATQCDLLLRNANSHNAVHPDAHLPDDVHAVLDQVDTDDYFTLCTELWNRGFDKEKIQTLLDQVRNGETLTKDEQTEMKNVRVRIRLLRSAYAAFDKTHAAPEAIDELTTSMGHLQDDLSAGDLKLAQKEAKNLSDLFGKKSMKAISNELDEFRSASGKSFRKWVRSQADEIEELTSKPQVTPKQFHETRKAVTRLLAVVDVINAVEPTRSSLELGDYLSSLNTQMGDIHDDLVEEKIQGAIDYEKDKMEFPADIRRQLEALVDSLN
jgi:hypothetical protein